MQKYKIVVAYDGTDYAGWQVQPNQRGVANIVQNRFKGVFKTPILLTGASRTDAGVHAMGQVATFHTDISITPEKMQEVWNNALPSAITIRMLERCSEYFHARYDVTSKTYWYHFFTERPLPTVQRFGAFFHHELDIKKLEKALQIFVGTHDFRSFCTGDEMESTVRTIDSICLDFNEQLQAHRIIFTGKGFLRYMIRRIVGACLQVASKDEMAIEHLRNALEACDPQQKLFKAEAKGLMLYKIEY